jgi:hypothetical protein
MSACFSVSARSCAEIDCSSVFTFEFKLSIRALRSFSLFFSSSSSFAVSAFTLELDVPLDEEEVDDVADVDRVMGASVELP